MANKFREGYQIHDMTELVEAVFHGDGIYWHHKYLQPAFVKNMTLHTLQMGIWGGNVFTVVKNQ